MIMQIDVEGSGPTLVLVHSLLTDSHAFDEVVPELAKSFRVVRISLPGFGTTPPLEIDSPTIFDLADVVAAGLKTAHVDSHCAVLGNGLGAFVCVALAIRHGDSFGPLIIANGGAAFSDERRLAFTKMADLVEDSGMDAVVDLAVRRIFPEQYLSAHPDVIDIRREVLVRTHAGAFADSCRALRDLDLRPRLAEIDNPTLVLGGGADQTTPPEMGQELAAGIGGAHFVELEGCGHCPPLEQPEEFIHEVESFLDLVQQRP